MDTFQITLRHRSGLTKRRYLTLREMVALVSEPVPMEWTRTVWRLPESISQAEYYRAVAAPDDGVSLYDLERAKAERVRDERAMMALQRQGELDRAQAERAARGQVILANALARRDALRARIAARRA